LSSFYPKDNRLSVNQGRHFYRFKPALQCEHIHLLFSKTIDWNLIETMLPEVLPVHRDGVSRDTSADPGQVYGVGQLTALTRVLTLGSKERFQRRCRAAGLDPGLAAFWPQAEVASDTATTYVFCWSSVPTMCSVRMEIPPYDSGVCTWPRAEASSPVPMNA
jgi:hypothetical protein